MKKEEYSKAQYAGFKTKKPAKGTPGFVVEYKDVKNPRTNGTIFRDRYSKEGVLLSKNEIDSNNWKFVKITAGSAKGETRAYSPNGTLYHRKTADASKIEYYDYDANLKIKSICDFKKNTETYYNGKTTPDSIISHKKDHWSGDGVRVE